MATVKLYLDKRSQKMNGLYPLRITLCHHQRSAYINVGIDLLLEQWDDIRLKVVKHPQKVYLNQFAQSRLSAVQNELFKLVDSGQARGMSVVALKEAVMSALDPEVEPMTFVGYFEKCIEKKKSLRTREIYQSTLNKIMALRPQANRLYFENITPDWLRIFDKDMAETAPSVNARNIHLRNIRAVFNDALDDELTSLYPFRKFKIKNAETPKRSLTVEKLRELWYWEDLHNNQREYLDIFKLTFLLIGINIIDLMNLREADYTEGRIHYYRAKTGRFYDIKVEPEAADIIERYRGKDGIFLLNMMENRLTHKNYARQVNEGLQRIGVWKRIKGRGGKWEVKALNDKLTTYYARHTWATLAAQLEIPKETIAAALGHGSKSVTDIYIDFDQKKVDAANRKVIDYVLGGAESKDV